MTVHDPASLCPEQSPTGHFAATGPLVRPLAWFAAFTIVAAVSNFVLFGPVRLAGFTPDIPPGFAGAVTSSLLLAGLGLIACLSAALGRRRHLVASRSSITKKSALPSSPWGQTALTLLLTLGAICVIIDDWPRHLPAGVGTDLSLDFPVASALLLLAIPWLLAERYVVALPPQRLPEAGDLDALLFLPVICVGAEAFLQVAQAFGLGSLYWPRVILAVVLLLISAEIALRSLAVRFLPPPDSASSRATIRSLLAMTLRGRSLSPSGMASLVRSQFGMDFSRSWALRFMRAAGIPVVLLMLAFCWFLTGVSRIDLDQRGAYERFGVVARMLGPGLHLVLPWPFGVVRHLELGIIHSSSINFDDRGGALDTGDRSSAEGAAPASANRLWELGTAVRCVLYHRRRRADPRVPDC